MSREQEQLAALKMKMIAHDHGSPKRIQHFLKVQSFAEAIAKGEGIDEHTLFILQTLGLIHDIGIRVALEQYGKCNGQLQEDTGPAPARAMLEELGYAEEDIQRICLIIENHHTYTAQIEGDDFQILLEADACVNMFEKDISDDARRAMLKNVFKTETGKRIYRMMFGFEEE